MNREESLKSKFVDDGKLTFGYENDNYEDNIYKPSHITAPVSNTRNHTNGTGSTFTVRTGTTLMRIGKMWKYGTRWLLQDMQKQVKKIDTAAGCTGCSEQDRTGLARSWEFRFGMRRNDVSEYIKKSDVIEAMEENSVMIKVFGVDRKMIDGIMLCQDIADMEVIDIDDNGWIPVEQNLPEEKENPITMDFYEYEVTFRSENICDIRHYKFGRGHWWHGCAIVDEYVVAWRKLPEPYRSKEE